MIRLPGLSTKEFPNAKKRTKIFWMFVNCVRPSTTSNKKQVTTQVFQLIFTPTHDNVSFYFRCTHEIATKLVGSRRLNDDVDAEKMKFICVKTVRLLFVSSPTLFRLESFCFCFFLAVCLFKWIINKSRTKWIENVFKTIYNFVLCCLVDTYI